MKTEGADNAREAFQFLALALGLVLAMRLGYWALDRWMAPAVNDALGQALAPFRAGYLIDDRTLVLGAGPLLERLGVAVLIAIAAAALLAVLAAVIARASGTGPVKWSARAARWTLLLAFPLLIIGALAFPVRSAHIGPAGISVTHRPLSIFTVNGTSELWRWQDIQSVNASEQLPESQGKGLLLMTNDGGHIAISIAETGTLSDLQHLAERLEAERLAHQQETR